MSEKSSSGYSMPDGLLFEIKITLVSPRNDDSALRGKHVIPAAARVLN